PLLQAQSSVTVGNPINSIVINEIVSLPNPEWIELCNPSAETVGMGGWALQYYQGNWKNIVSLDPGTTIGAWGTGNEYMVVNLAGVLPDNGASVRLINSAGQTIDVVTYPKISSGQSWARFKHEDTGKPLDTGNDANDFYISNNGWIVLEGPTQGVPNDRKMPVMDIEKAVTPPTAEPGQTVTYTITYSNTGDGNAKDVWVNDTLPASVDLVSAIPAPTSVSGQDLVWFFNTVGHGTTNYISITAKVNDLPADGEVVTNAATLVYHDALKRPMGTGTAWANFTCSRPVISVEKAADVSTVVAGGTIVYTIYYNNTGSATAGSVWINDTLPTGVTFVSATPAPNTASGQNLEWLITNVAPGVHSITVTVTVDSNATGTLTNWATLDYASAYGLTLESSADSAMVVIPEMRHLAIPAFGMMFMGFIYLKRRGQNRGKKI
ncbi:MAG: lamin tail domain-containing protein, partial [Thermoplasmata archaeon]